MPRDASIFDSFFFSLLFIFLLFFAGLLQCSWAVTMLPDCFYAKKLERCFFFISQEKLFFAWFHVQSIYFAYIFCVHINIFFVFTLQIQDTYISIDFSSSKIHWRLNGQTVNALGCWSMVQGSSPSLGRTPTLKTVIQLQELQWPVWKA